MNITVNEELLAYIDPLTPDENEALERSLLAEGCRDALVLWGEVLVDGHNRHRICTQHGMPFQHRAEHPLQVAGRRASVDDRPAPGPAQRVRFPARRAGPAQEGHPDRARAASARRAVRFCCRSCAGRGTSPSRCPRRDAIAKSARISNNTINQIEKIQKSAAPELVAAVKSGTISINAAATVASLPVDAQVAAVAGGKKELQQAARQVRESKAVARTEPESPEGVIARLRQTITELSAENAALKARLAGLGS